jgi:hypothetical protein
VLTESMLTIQCYKPKKEEGVIKSFVAAVRSLYSLVLDDGRSSVTTESFLFLAIKAELLSCNL